MLEDDDVNSKKGIYIYVLTRKERHLNIRTFSQNQKREAYERQKGICPVCKEHFEIEEMEGDHITPWHEDGRTSAENCQMLCKHDNRIKSLILLAPATVWFSHREAFNEVKCPILMYIGTKDNISGPECPRLLQSGKKGDFMPYGYHVKLVLDGVPDSTKVQCKIIENAGHFSFLSPFPESMVNPKFAPSQDPAGFNRKDFHDKLNAEILDFLLRETALNKSEVKTHEE